MRVYGRITGEDGTVSWAVVETSENGLSDYPAATAMIQCIKLNLGESPFWGTFGIPAHQSVMSQIAPTYHTQRIQTFYANFFMYLSITRIPKATYKNTSVLTPTFSVQILTHYGVPLELEVPV